METFEGMRIFTHVVQAGNFSAAGRELGLSSSSISRKIAQLEQDLGIRLLNRNSRKMVLTDIGRSYFKKASAIVEQVEEIDRFILDQSAAPRGVLSVHTCASLCEHFLIPSLPTFQSQHRDITLDFRLSDGRPNITDEGIDVSIQIGPPNDLSLKIRRLSAGVTRVLCASPTYLNLRPAISRPEDLLGHNCLIARSETVLGAGGASWLYKGTTGTKELRVAGGFIADDTATLLHAAAAGIGIALLPAWLVAGDLNSGQLKRILSQHEFTPTCFDNGIYAVFTESRLMTPKVRLFVDFLVDVFRKQDPYITRTTLDIRRYGADDLGRPHDALRWVSNQP